jgi:hypothetical protein
LFPINKTQRSSLMFEHYYILWVPSRCRCHVTSRGKC